MKDKLKYRDAEYFNENDTYLFDDSFGGTFQSKVIKVNNFWSAKNNYGVRLKATSIRCVIVDSNR